MDDLEKSYRLLELKPGATFKQCSEAREDMLALWNPDRLASHPRLRAKANRKIREIQLAYETVMKDVEQIDGNASSKQTPASSAAASMKRSSGRTEQEGGASLFDEVFVAGETARRAPRLPAWLVGVLILVTTLAFFVLRSSDSQSPPQPVSEPSAETSTPPPQSEEAASSRQPPDPSTPPNAVVADNQTTPAAQPVGQGPPAAAANRSAIPEIQTTPPVVARRSRETPSRSRPSRPQEGPVLLRETQPPAQTAQEEQASQENETAYQALLAASEVARTLAQGGFETVEFLEWRTVQRTDAEIWIDLVARGSDQREVHFIWSIGRQTGQTRPLNTHARDLERSGRPR